MGADDDRFGNVVSISGNIAMVSSHGDDDNFGSSGSVYVYQFDSGSWSFVTKLNANDAASSRPIQLFIRHFWK